MCYLSKTSIICIRVLKIDKYLFSSYSRILYPEDNPDKEDGYYSGDIDPLVDGDMVRLYHVETGALLSCTNISSPVARKHSLVYTEKTVIICNST